jgi:hypothetical protein
MCLRIMIAQKESFYKKKHRLVRLKAVLPGGERSRIHKPESTFTHSNTYSKLLMSATPRYDAGARRIRKGNGRPCSLKHYRCAVWAESMGRWTQSGRALVVVLHLKLCVCSAGECGGADLPLSLTSAPRHSAGASNMVGGASSPTLENQRHDGGPFPIPLRSISFGLCDSPSLVGKTPRSEFRRTNPGP